MSTIVFTFCRLGLVKNSKILETLLISVYVVILNFTIFFDHCNSIILIFTATFIPSFKIWVSAISHINTNVSIKFAFVFIFHQGYKITRQVFSLHRSFFIFCVHSDYTLCKSSRCINCSIHLDMVWGRDSLKICSTKYLSAGVLFWVHTLFLINREQGHWQMYKTNMHICFFASL